ncbi:class II glutamine amidotransferase [Cellvibrio japonicus]|uniref:Probable amidotransferase n=1 Tax=Cellvibrio japonicus (strain Ueda107) TaxID=498211 RepID=B3PJR5_CELJU|nr:class II glutamine amidotransferase [Cellvibrio japonicus]ACE84461.1 probable amidotransferase [Cellvibrio japonicus Ueda107]QEI12702.1 class II glutamine amidotransferase [Cellvibrio japonicus]QEI16276.1 class II glutamine amidotransferase [Cellvibrio japonicus]QEI19854.1 class II glutamine amidotransferase [Cellvibrio japonicus]
MCQLLGMSCREPATINFSLEGFQARGGLTDEHKDGWGIAFFETDSAHNRCRIFLDHQPAANSALLDNIKAQQIKSRLILAHIRKATFGDVSLRNCHPFQRELWGQTWVFSHNGDLHNFHPLLSGRYLPVGETDSERAFCYLLERLEQYFPQATAQKPPDYRAIYQALRALSQEIAAFGTFNMMLSNGDLLFTHCSTHLAYVERRYPFTRVTLVDSETSLDLSAHNSPADQMIVIATKPLTRDETWTCYQPGESLLFRAGSAVAGSHRYPLSPTTEQSMEQSTQPSLTLHTGYPAVTINWAMA